MPIDPSIALSGRPAQIPGPMEMYSQLLGLQQQQQQMELQKQSVGALAEERQARAQQQQMGLQQAQQNQATMSAAQKAIALIDAGKSDEALSGLPPQVKGLVQDYLLKQDQYKAQRQKLQMDDLQESAKLIRSTGYDPTIAEGVFALKAKEMPQAAQIWEQVKADPAKLKAVVDHYAGITDKPEAGFTLGEGQTRYDAQGKAIASGPPKTEKPQGKWVPDYDATGKPIERWVADGPGAVAPRMDTAASGFTLAPGATRYDAQGNAIASAPARAERPAGKWIADYDANGKPIERWVEEGPGAVAPRQEAVVPPQRPMVVGPGAKVIDPTTGATVAEGNPQTVRDAALARVDTVNDAGQPVTKFVQPAAGLELPKPDAALTRPRDVKPGSEEAFFIAYAKKMGKRPDDLSLEEQSKARQAWSRADDKPASATDDAGLKLTAAGRDAAARNYAVTGQLPPMGMGKEAAATKAAIVNRAAEMYPDLDLASNSAEYRSNRGSLVKMQAQRDAIGAFEQTAGKNIDIFLKEAGKVVDTGSPLANTAVRMVSGKMLGSENQAAYDAARQVAVNEIAKITSGSSNLGGALSDSARKEISDFNPQNATLKQTVAVMRILKQDMANRTIAMDKQIAEISGRIKGGNSQSAPPAQSAPAGPSSLFSYQDYLKQKGGK